MKSIEPWPHRSMSYSELCERLGTTVEAVEAQRCGDHDYRLVGWSAAERGLQQEGDSFYRTRRMETYWQCAKCRCPVAGAAELVTGKDNLSELVR